MGTEYTAYVVADPVKTAKITLFDQCGDNSDKYQRAGELLYRYGWHITAGSPPLGVGATYTKHVRFSGRKDLTFWCRADILSHSVSFYNKTFGISFPLVAYDKLEEMLESWAKENIQLRVTVKPEREKPYWVVDLQDRFLGEGTLTEVQDIFRERYPHFDAKHIQHFIYEND